MPRHPAYCIMHLHVPTYFHDRITKAVTREEPVSIKLDLTGTPEHRLYVTVGQKKRILEAVEKGRRDMTLRMSAKQAKYNKESEGGFLAGLLQSAIRFLPSILAGIAAGTAEYHKEGNGMFLGKQDHAYQITHSGEGLVIKPSHPRKLDGFYVKYGEHEFKGEGILHSLLGQIPLLNILF